MTNASGASGFGRPSMAAALFLIDDGATAAELSVRAAGLDTRAALAGLAELGLVRVAAGEGATTRYILTELGRRYRDASLFGQPEAITAHQELEQLRSDLLSA